MGSLEKPLRRVTGRGVREHDHVQVCAEALRRRPDERDVHPGDRHLRPIVWDREAIVGAALVFPRLGNGGQSEQQERRDESDPRAVHACPMDLQT